jgi:hypothetical protein
MCRQEKTVIMCALKDLQLLRNPPRIRRDVELKLLRIYKSSVE